MLSINSPEKLKAKRATGRASLMKNIFQGLFSPAAGEQVFTWMDVTAVFASVPLKWTKQGFIHIYHPDMWFCCLNKQDHRTAILVTWRTWSKRRQPQILAYRLEKGIRHLRSLLVPADKPALHRHSLEGTKEEKLSPFRCEWKEKLLLQVEGRREEVHECKPLSRSAGRFRDFSQACFIPVRTQMKSNAMTDQPSERLSSVSLGNGGFSSGFCPQLPSFPPYIIFPQMLGNCNCCNSRRHSHLWDQVNNSNNKSCHLTRDPENLCS